jgi:hypothetical protein
VRSQHQHLKEEEESRRNRGCRRGKEAARKWLMPGSEPGQVMKSGAVASMPVSRGPTWVRPGEGNDCRPSPYFVTHHFQRCEEGRSYHVE